MEEIKFRIKYLNWKDKTWQYYTLCALIDHATDPGQPCIINQYTGLKDKNGKEIYEGDIVEYDKTYGFDEDRIITAIGQCTIGLEGIRFSGDYLHEDCFNFKVIGNIYENPELLEGDSHHSL